MQKTNLESALDEGGGDGPYTIFVPSNEALSNMKDGVLHYLLSPEVPSLPCLPCWYWVSLTAPVCVL